MCVLVKYEFVFRVIFVVSEEERETSAALAQGLIASRCYPLQVSKHLTIR